LLDKNYCVHGADLSRIADCCPALTNLDLAAVIVPGASLAGLTGLHATLQVLDLGYKTDCKNTAMASVAQLTSLRRLECSGSLLTEAGLQHLTALHATLQVLKLWNTTECKDTTMASLAQLTSLRRLDCSGDSLTEAGLQHLTTLRRLTTLSVCGSGMRRVARRARRLSPARGWSSGKFCLSLEAPCTVSKEGVMWVQHSAVVSRMTHSALKQPV
jgi:hypothetical protein